MCTHTPPPVVPTQATHCLGRDMEYQPHWSPQSGRSRDRPRHSWWGPTVREVTGQATPLTVGPLGFRLEGRKTEVFRGEGACGHIAERSGQSLAGGRTLPAPRGSWPLPTSQHRLYVTHPATSVNNEQKPTCLCVFLSVRLAQLKNSRGLRLLGGF